MRLQLGFGLARVSALCWLVAALVALALTGCGDGGDGGGEGCDGCSDDEVCVAYLGDDPADDREECAAIPGDCGGSASCGDNACVSALYDLCESGWISVGCAETGGTIVSCNPS